jgi:hypothetical protein
VGEGLVAQVSNRHYKLDSTHTPITKELRRLGWPYRDTARYPGFGADLLARHKDGYPMLLEVKAPKVYDLTDSEKALQSMFPTFYRVVRDWDDVLRALGLA